MAKNEQYKSDKVNTEEDVSSPNFTRFMVGTYLDPKTGEWMLSYAHFDPALKVIGPLQTERVAGDREVMRERLMIKQINLGLLTPEPITQERKEEIY